MFARLALVLLALASCDRARPVRVVAVADAGARAAAPVVASLEKSCATICAKNVSCAGLQADEAKAKQADCEKVCRSQGDGSALAAEILPQAMASVADSCGAVPCEKFAGCYMDTLKAMQEKLTGAPARASAPLPAETRARFVMLVCQVVAESPGKIPDLNNPNPSAKLRELKDMVALIATQQGDVSAIAELMKEAIATCP